LGSKLHFGRIRAETAKTIRNGFYYFISDRINWIIRIKFTFGEEKNFRVTKNLLSYLHL